MFKGLVWYTKKEVWPRAGELLTEKEIWVSIVSGIAVATFYKGQYSTQLPDLFSGMLSYASIAFGFCVAGLTLALTLPDRQFSEKMVRTMVDEREKDAYSGLLFVFSWTAILHWIAMIVFLVGVAVIAPTWGNSLTLIKKFYLGISSVIIVYCFMMFLSTLITLAQLGSAYISHLREPKRRGRR